MAKEGMSFQLQSPPKRNRGLSPRIKFPPRNSYRIPKSFWKPGAELSKRVLDTLTWCARCVADASKPCRWQCAFSQPASNAASRAQLQTSIDSLGSLMLVLILPLAWALESVAN
eukprot:2755124-Amphidinium_carterae.1